MIEMWDEIFSLQNAAIKSALDSGNGTAAFELIHEELDKVWAEVFRVLKKGGFACINIGDATRKVNGEFKLYANHSRILQRCQSLGFTALPEILWRKQTNTPNKFMGSGMLPAGAYVTLEHEYILIFRKGVKREFKTAADKLRRMQSSFFWEERNLWFSDVWADLKGTKQNNIDKNVRERSGAYPFELPYRIINMFSLREDTVLDPFLGTGTTTAAAMATCRNSLGVEVDSNFSRLFMESFQGICAFSNKLIETRIASHLKFVKERTLEKGPLGYLNKTYGFPVMTRQERELLFDELDNIQFKDNLMEVNYKEKSGFVLEDRSIRSASKVPLSKRI
jgi:DNA modification methylase